MGRLSAMLPKPLYRICRRCLNMLGVRTRIKGPRNRIRMQLAALRDVEIDIEGSDNEINIEAGCFLKTVSIRMRGTGHQLHIGRDTWAVDENFHFEMQDCGIYIGQRVRMNGGKLSAAETGTSIFIGDDCGLAEGLDMRTTDSHAIVDLDTGAPLNRGADIRIGRNVWMGLQVLVMKGAVVGDHSVVGARSIVLREIPPRCLAVGAPARVIRENVSWVWDSPSSFARLSEADLKMLRSGEDA
ncbi:acyltransferase [Nitratidesulfovibrio sp. D1]|uniref:acyltransferase n=1 Tax=Nitratidesulfovibrio sp. D1 TaxID=3440151 RepID=UPI003EC0B513